MFENVEHKQGKKHAFAKPGTSRHKVSRKILFIRNLFLTTEIDNWSDNLKISRAQLLKSDKNKLIFQNNIRCGVPQAPKPPQIL